VDRIPASERTREKLKILMFGSEVEEGRSELVRLAARLIIAEALEVEARDALGRDYYARGAESSQDFDTLGRTSAKGRPSPFRSERARVRSRRILPVAERPGQGRLTEPAADARLWRRGLLFVPQSGRRWFLFKNWIRRIEAETTPPRQVRARLPGCPRHQPGICRRTGTA
jgi:hypothetical protein